MVAGIKLGWDACKASTLFEVSLMYCGLEKRQGIGLEIFCQPDQKVQCSVSDVLVEATKVAYKC